MSAADQAPPAPSWETDPVIPGVRLLHVGLVFMHEGQPFHLRLDDPRVQVVQDSDGLIHGHIDADQVVRLWVPQELLDAR
jgi:hypothetical protein